MDVSQPKRKAEDPGGDEAAEAALRAARPPPPPPTAAAPAAPPPLGDHSGYMLEALLPLADVRLKTSGGRALPAHANVLIAQCGALARASELLAAGSRERPVVLGQPFEGCSEADAAAFLGCLYRPERYKANGAAAAAPAVARLAHAVRTELSSIDHFVGKETGKIPKQTTDQPLITRLHTAARLRVGARACGEPSRDRNAQLPRRHLRRARAGRGLRPARGAH